VVSLIWSRRVLSENTLLPTKLICLMRETSPSSTEKVIATRLRSTGVTVVVTLAP
jgi:hypothetical protein